jgi:FkbM family methyltransferase
MNMLDCVYRKLVVPNADLFYRLKRKMRYQVHETTLYGKPMKYIDSSYIPMKKEIVKTGIYAFKSDKENPYILDCGANIGLSVLFFKHLYPEAEVVTFEADPTICGILNDNLRSQGVTGVTVVNKAVWKEDTTVTFFKEGADAGRIDGATGDKETIEVPTTVLSRYIDREVDFLKIDIEGAEVEVLNEIRDRLHLVKRMFVEYHSFVGREQALDDVLKVLSDAGFRYYIQTIGIFSHQPFMQVNQMMGMDMQMNISAYRA